jgi:hypothetical protein
MAAELGSAGHIVMTDTLCCTEEAIGSSGNEDPMASSVV